MKGFKKYMKKIWGNYIEFQKATEIWQKLSKVYNKDNLEYFDRYLKYITKNMKIFEVYDLMNNFDNTLIPKITKAEINDIENKFLNIRKQKLYNALKIYNLDKIIEINKIKNKKIREEKLIEFLNNFDFIDIEIINYFASYCDICELFISSKITDKIFINACLNGDNKKIRSYLKEDLRLDPLNIYCVHENIILNTDVLKTINEYLHNDKLDFSLKIKVVNSILKAVPEYDFNTYNSFGSYAIDEKNLFMILEYFKKQNITNFEFIKLYNKVKRKTTNTQEVENINNWEMSGKFKEVKVLKYEKEI